jgi:hypothetical protein
VSAEPHQCQIPADADRARSELLPALVADIGRMLELKHGLLRGDFLQPNRQPTDLAAELPGHRERARRLADADLAAGVALKLVAPADAEIAPWITQRRC